MQNADANRPDPQGWLLPCLSIALGVTALRIVLMMFNRTDLFVDEAQYWLWGQEFALGYYSKPPMIGWVIRLFTEIADSSSPFWVRFPAPVFHCVTATILASIAAEYYGRSAAIWTTAAFITLPLVTVGSFLISTDTIMFPFLALALKAWLRVLKDQSTGWALTAGVALGLAFLSKYAAVYYLISAVLAATFLPTARQRGRCVATTLLAFGVTISPTVIWNIQNGLSTVEHTLDNADWVRDPGEKANLNFAGLAEFFGSQFAVFGPIFFGALIVLVRRRGAARTDYRFLLLFSAPIVAIVCIQALLSQAYANWAVAAYLAGSLVVVAWLSRQHPAWLWGSLTLHGAFALAVPLLSVFGTGLSYGANDRLVLERYLGRTEMSETILQLARDNDVSTVVADQRDILADLFYVGRDGDIDLFAKPEAGRAPNHYVLKYPFPANSDETIILVTQRDKAPRACRKNATLIERLAPTQGAYRIRGQNVFLLPGSCLKL